MDYRRIVFLLILTALCFTFLAAQIRQKGKASYYSKKLTGARTSSGERLHHDSMTCAHCTYPFGTRLKVTNPSTGKIVFVRVTDRGPYRHGRIVDLSWGAAKALGMLSQGVTTVIVEPVDTTIVPFRPNENIKLPEYDYESSIYSDGFRPAWQEMKEINHKDATTMPKKKAAGNAATTLPKDGNPGVGAQLDGSKPGSATFSSHGVAYPRQGTTSLNRGEGNPANASKSPIHGNNMRKTDSRHTTGGSLDDINNRPNTSRVYTKRQSGK